MTNSIQTLKTASEGLTKIGREYELKQVRELMRFIPVDERSRVIIRLKRANDMGGSLEELLNVLTEGGYNGRSWEKP